MTKTSNMPNSPTPQTYTQTLAQAGLTAEQAQIYEILLKNGASSARKVAQNTPLKRSLVYKILDDLIKLGLCEKNDVAGKISIFTPAHPLKLKEFVERQEQKAKTAGLALDGLMGQLTSDFNLISGKPGVKFYEGKDGIIKIYEQLLAHGKNIDSIEDKGEMVTLIPDYVRKFIKKRIELNIHNRVIAPSDSPINTTDPKQLRESRFLKTSEFPFRMDVKIAGQLLSLITFQKENPVGVLVDNQEIADNFRLLFEAVWKMLEKKSEDTRPRSSMLVSGTPAPSQV